MRAKKTVLFLLCGTLMSCSEQPVKDPLQNTKKLAAEGHATLYNNGAFEVPMTTIHIIPPGPSAMQLASEMAGLRARQSFQESIKHAKESVGLAQAGVEKSKQAAREIVQGADDIAKGANEVSLFGARVAKASPGITRGIVGASVTYSREVYTAASEAGADLAQDSLAAGSEISAGTTDATGKVWAGTLAVAGTASSASRAASRKHAAYAVDSFVQGYAAVPAKLGARAGAVAESASFGKFVDAYQRSNAWRAAESGKMTNILVSTTANYSKDIGESFHAASLEITQGSHESGYTLALLKSLRWVVQGVFWDATIKPAGKLAGASLGYVTVNALAYPALITVNEGVAVANVAVQVTWNGAGSVYDVTAPTATAALAGLFSAVDLVGGHALAGTELAVGSVATAGTYGIGKTAAAVTGGGGYVAGRTVQYVGAPLSSVGVAAGGGAVGVVVGGAAAVTGAGMAVAGAAGYAATETTGVVAAGTVLAGGSAASVVAGTALGSYELASAVVVPAGYELGSGLVLGYGTLSQLGAQTVLAVADASYMVLSLEGPNWVLYAVKGKLNNGEDLPPGTLLDLEAMQKSGETFIAVPVSKEEMQRLVADVPGQLPVKAEANHAQSAALQP